MLYLRFKIVAKISSRKSTITTIVEKRIIVMLVLTVPLITILIMNSEDITDIQIPRLNLASALYISPSPVNGIYQSEKIGFSIELPIDWNSTVLDYPSGFYGDEGGIITILSKPITVENNNNLNKHIYTMTILAMDDLYVERLKNISRSISNMNSLKSEESTQSVEKTTCNSISDVFVTINTATGNQVTMKCSTARPIVSISYIFVTRNNSLIQLKYIADSSNENDKYINQFEKSVKTLRIFNPADVRNSQVYLDYLDYLNSTGISDELRLAK